MCGIIAAASNRNVGKLLVQGLHKMEYRGYDSAGIALHQTDQIAHPVSYTHLTLPTNGTV